MRNGAPKSESDNMILVTMMKEYHQPYSEILKIPADKLMFLVELHSAITEYEQKEVEKQEREIKKILGKQKIRI